MHLRRRFAACFMVGMGLPALLSAGCAAGKAPEGSKDPEAVHIEKVAQLTNKEYPPAHNRKKPRDINEVKAWAMKEGRAEESDFVSTRDGQTYVLNKGGALHEQTGEDGKKFVVPPGGTAATKMDDTGIQYMGGGSGIPGAGPGGRPGMPGAGPGQPGRPGMPPGQPGRPGQPGQPVPQQPPGQPR